MSQLLLLGGWPLRCLRILSCSSRLVNKSGKVAHLLNTTFNKCITLLDLGAPPVAHSAISLGVA